MNPFKRRSVAFVATLAFVASACGTTAVSPSAAPTAPPATAAPATPRRPRRPPRPRPPRPRPPRRLRLRRLRRQRHHHRPTAARRPPSPTAVASADFSFVVDSEPTTLAGAPDDLPTSWIVGLIYSTLYQPNYKLEYVPLVADGAPVTSADGLTWTVKIKSGIKFHDGSDLTSADVKFSFDLLHSRTAARTRTPAHRSPTT